MSIFRYLIAVLAVFALVAPAAASAAPGAINVVDESEFGPLFYDASGTNLQDHSVTVAPGETVTFNYPVGLGSHNVAFVNPGPQPSSCTQTSGTVIPGFPVPPLPAFSLPAPWGGTCTFAQPGVYNFYCVAHGYMIGDVTVAEPGALLSFTGPRVVQQTVPESALPRDIAGTIAALDVNEGTAIGGGTQFVMVCERSATVAAGAEPLLPGALDQHRPDRRVVLPPVERRGDPLDHGERKRVDGFRPVERDAPKLAGGGDMEV